jgi:hypothetical protein
MVNGITPGNRRYPRRKLGLKAEVLQFFMHPQKHILAQLFPVLFILYESSYHMGYQSFMLLYQLYKRLYITGYYARNQCLVVGHFHIRHWNSPGCCKSIKKIKQSAESSAAISKRPGTSQSQQKKAEWLQHCRNVLCHTL